MKELQTFNFNNQPVRTVQLNKLIRKANKMTPEQFINQPMEFFEKLFEEIYEGIDLTIHEPNQKPKKGRKKGRIKSLWKH